jgi:hypothetical protein
VSTAPAASNLPSRRRRRITRIIAGAWLLLGLGSCTSVLNLDQYANVAEEMCSLLDRCYARSENVNCQPILEGHLNAADSSVRTEWLAGFTSYSCLDSCSAGRRCLDIEPLCTFAGACSRRQDCCGSLEGHADCKAGACCNTRGSGCAKDSDCCAGAGACDPVNHTCGGTHCVEASQACELDAECCTKICKDHFCSRTTCNPDKFECSVDQDCCSSFCDPTSHACAEPPTCVMAGESCTVETDCCAGQRCLFAPGAIVGQCAASTCGVADLDCATDDQCCSGHCDPSFFFCSAACAYQGSACLGDVDCCLGHCESGTCAGTCSTTYCARNTDCCSNSCVAGVCAAECNPPSLHSPCAGGGPLALTMDATACVDAVCATDPYCCCGAWDDVCVTAAVKQGSICTSLCH